MNKYIIQNDESGKQFIAGPVMMAYNFSENKWREHFASLPKYEWQGEKREVGDVVVEGMDFWLGLAEADEHCENVVEGHITLAIEIKKDSAKVESFLDVLVTNYQAQIAGFYNDDKTDEERKIRNAVIQEYEDLIAIYKSKYKTSPPKVAIPLSKAEEKPSISKVMKELREVGTAWDNIICVCRGLMRDNPCDCNCKEFHDESLPNERPKAEEVKEKEDDEIFKKALQEIIHTTASKAYSPFQKVNRCFDIAYFALSLKDQS